MEKNKRINEFEGAFSLKKPDSALAYDKLIYTLREERTGAWDISAIKNYLSVAYCVVVDKSTSSLACGKKDSGLYRGRYYLFNTGLETNHQPLYCTGLETNHQPLYCIGEAQESGVAKFLDFCTKREIVENYKLENDAFHNLKSPKELLSSDPDLKDFSNGQRINFPEDNYCDSDLQDRLYWLKAKIEKNKQSNTGECKDFKGWLHIILDNCDRLPMSILREITDVNYGYNNKDKNYNYKIQYDILSHKDMDVVKGRLETAKGILEAAKEYSYQLAGVENDMIVPYYYPEGYCINYAMPLYLRHNEKPDCALVFDKEGVVHTLLTMSQLRLNIKIMGLGRHYKWL